MDISKRKADHVNLSVSGTVNYEKKTGFERYDFIHNALPEVNFDDISTEATLLGRTFAFPLFISSMTGGYSRAGAVNAIIAEFCEKENLPFGVGSQRILFESSEITNSFSIVRERAPHAFIASNIGGSQLIGGLKSEQVNLIIESIKADAIIVHLNPLQELMQPEGDRSFKGIKEGIKQLVQDTDIPVIVKETGAGISGEVAQELVELGVKVIDVSGAGGTSWSKVENTRDNNQLHKVSFNNWGIPTVECILSLRKHNRNDYEVIASGGIRNSFDMIKALCLGADFTAMAQPIIKAVIEEGMDGLDESLRVLKYQFKTAMCLLGARTIEELGYHQLRMV
ncbi:MAG TPA: type 2 isopentenyl-diphosphate Delta-isomerase [Balneolales bacterium]|nr:type 2 isopentenyl-diphosphate Delta-isomerase [Balneolales bacterium]